MRFAAAVWLAAATILVGFVHRPLQGFPSAAEMVEGGGVAFGSFCVTRISVVDETGATKFQWTTRICDACLLAAAPGLGAVAEIAPPPPPRRAIDRVAGGEARPVACVGVRAVARGPPSIV